MKEIFKYLIVLVFLSGCSTKPKPCHDYSAELDKLYTEYQNKEISEEAFASLVKGVSIEMRLRKVMEEYRDQD